MSTYPDASQSLYSPISTSERNEHGLVLIGRPKKRYCLSRLEQQPVVFPDNQIFEHGKHLLSGT